MKVRVVDVASIITMVLAVLLVAIPLMFLYTHLPLAFWSDIVLGLAMFVLALGRNRGWGPWAAWINLLSGVYLLFLPYAAGFFTYTVGADIGTVVASFINVAFGLAIAIVSAWDLFAVFEKPQAEMAVFTSAEPGKRD